MSQTTTGRHCPNCYAAEKGDYKSPPGWHSRVIEHHETCQDPTATPINHMDWDDLMLAGKKPPCPRPFGPDRNGSPRCRSGSIASKGTRTYCTCDTCF